MIRAEASTVQVVARSARELRIWIDTDVGTPGGEDAVQVVAHHALWAVVHDPLGILSWIAVRLDRHQTEIPGTGGWLGTCDLEPEQILANLLEQNELPTDLFGRRAPRADAASVLPRAAHQHLPRLPRLRAHRAGRHRGVPLDPGRPGRPRTGSRRPVRHLRLHDRRAPLRPHPHPRTRLPIPRHPHPGAVAAIPCGLPRLRAALHPGGNQRHRHRTCSSPDRGGFPPP
jgi:hypothetical protein